MSAPAPALAYRMAIRAAAALAPLLARWSPKLRAGVAGRRETLGRVPEWAGAPGPRLLLHGASAGELRQAEPVLRRLCAAHPGLCPVVTCFSPSGLNVARALGGPAAGLLPWDTPGDVARFLDALRPDAILFASGDLWPELALAAHRRGIPLGLIGARLATESGRRRWPAARVLRPVWGVLHAVGAVSSADADRLVAAGTRPECTAVTGDPRHDAVLERLGATPLPDGDPRLLVAGSTWPADEDLVLRAFATVRPRHPAARLVIAPHEPSPAHIARLRAAARAAGVPAEAFEVVTEVGELAFRYAAGGMALVGGGFGRAGVHSVLEPAAAGLPVVAGPGAARRPEALALHDAGGLTILPAEGPGAELAALWLDWLEQPERRQAAGRRARAAVERGKGAAERTARLVGPLLARKRAPE